MRSRKKENHGLEWSRAKSPGARVQFPGPTSGDLKPPLTPTVAALPGVFSPDTEIPHLRQAETIAQALSTEVCSPQLRPVDPVRMKVISWVVGVAGPAAVLWGLWGAKAEGFPRSEDLLQPGWRQPQGAG